MEKKSLYIQTPAQIIDRFKNKHNVRVVLNLFLCVGTICVFILLLLGKIDKLNGVITLVSLFLLLCWVRKNKTNQVLEWMNILVEDCDPSKFLELMERFERERKYQNAKDSIAYCKAVAYYYLGEYEESYKMIEMIENRKNDLLILVTYYKILVALYKKQKNAEKLSEIRIEISKETRLWHSHEIQKIGMEILILIDTAILEYSGNYDMAKQLEIRQLDQSKHEIDKVQWTYELANTCYLMGDYMQANIMSRYVIEHGNTLHFVHKAQELQIKALQKLARG